MNELIFGALGVENSRLSCPKCMGRSFRLMAGPEGTDMRWKCEECGIEGRQDELVSEWPEGTLRVSDIKVKDE